MTTTDNSRADALTDEQIAKALAVWFAPDAGSFKSRMRAAILAAYPVEQHEAAPADARAALLRDALFYLKGNLPDSPSDHKRKAQVIAGLEGLARAASSQPAAAAGQEALVIPAAYALVPKVITQPMMRASGIGSHSWGCALEAAPPAQVATRQGLTDELQYVLRESLDCLGNLPDGPTDQQRYASLKAALRAILEGAKR